MKIKSRLALFISALLVSVVFLGCDGNILSSVATSTASVDISYQNIIGVLSSTVYYQCDTGIFSSEAKATNQVQLVTNTEDNIVRFSALVDNKYILYATNNQDDATGKKLHVYDITDTGNNGTYTITNTGITTIKGLYNNGYLLAEEVSGSQNSYHLFYTPTIDPIEKTITFAGSIGFDYAEGYNLANFYQMTGTENATTGYALLSFVKEVTSDSSSTSYLYKNYVIDLGNHTSPAFTTEIAYETANFVVDSLSNFYLLTIGGRIFKGVSGGSLTQVAYNSYYYATNAFMYLVTSGTNNYLVTKSTTKSSALIVYTITNSDSVSTTSIRKGYGLRLCSDLVNATYQIAENDLLVATNESGMVRITITPASVTSNTIANGTSTDFEKYTLPL